MIAVPLTPDQIAALTALRSALFPDDDLSQYSSAMQMPIARTLECLRVGAITLSTVDLVVYVIWLAAATSVVHVVIGSTHTEQLAGIIEAIESQLRTASEVPRDCQ
jgi:hypothetical protein